MTKMTQAQLRSGTALAIFAGAISLATAAGAQTAEPQATTAAASEDNTQASGDTPAEIIVTARRRDERLLDAPVAITAISGDALTQYQATRVSDIATMVPSLIAGKAASGSSASIFLRGVGSTALSAGFDQSVSFVIDGLPMSRGREISLPQFDIAGVEVMRGPQALFFGKNTTGGLISLTSNNPTDRFEAGIRGGYGFEARERYVEAYVSGPITDTLRARIAGRYSDSDGAFINTAAPTYTNYIPGQERTGMGRRRGAAESLGLRATIDWDVSPNFSLRLKTGMTQVNDGGPTDIVERLCGGGRTTPMAATVAPGMSFPSSPNADCRIDGRSDQSALPAAVAAANYRDARDGRMYADFESQYAVLTANIDSDPFSVNSITGYYHFRQRDLNNVSGEAYPASFSQFADFKQFSQELRFQSSFDGPFNVMFGGFYSHGKFVFNTDAYIVPLPYDALNQTYVTFKRDNGFSSDSMSFFAEGTFQLTDQLELSAGARYSMEARNSYQRSLPANIAFSAAFPGGISLRDRYRDDNLSPQVTLRWKPSRDTTLYASYKQGFKGGGFNLSQALSPAFLANPQLGVDTGRYGAETAEGFEAGLRTLLLDRHLTFSITAYRYEYSDLQVQFFNPLDMSLTAGNAGKLRTQGVEADFNFRVPGVDGLTFRGAAAYNDAEYSDYIGQCYPGQTISLGCDLNFSAATGQYSAQDYNGRTPPKAPHFAGRLGFSYDLPLSDNGMRVTFGGDVSHTSSYNFTDALRPDAIQRAFTKFDGTIALHGPEDRWSLALIGRNLTNRRVVTAANDIPFAGGTGTGTNGPGVVADMSAFVDNPREVFVEFSVKF
jgi:outer membrane receptor protein involved in Fe transport